MRIAWQAAALPVRPPERCHGEGDYVWRRDCRLKPALRQVETVVLRGTSAVGGEIRHETGDYVAADLNGAVEAWRLRRGRDTVLETLEPVAIQLLSQAESWREAQRGGKITVAALLTGGKVDCQYTRFRCVAEGSHRVWKPTDTWRAEVDDEPEEIVGEIHLAPGTGWAEQSDGLGAALLAFVGQVDVPETLDTSDAPTAVSP
jgi:hypothetical protein